MKSWTPLTRINPDPRTLPSAEEIARFANVPMAEARLAAARAIEGDWWENDQYMVVATRDAPGLVHLSIRRQDRKPFTDWRSLQEIKNQLVGPECEGVELYPAESRRVDAANQYHLWVIENPTFRFPFGFDAGRMVLEGDLGRSKQRPLSEKVK